MRTTRFLLGLPFLVLGFGLIGLATLISGNWYETCPAEDAAH